MGQSWGTLNIAIRVFNEVKVISATGVVVVMMAVTMVGISDSQAAVKKANHQASKKTNATDCYGLISDLQSMKKAERSLMQTMVNRSETMAETLNKYAEDFNHIKSNNQKIEKKDILSLRRSADTFIDHKHREELLVQRYQKASDLLLKEVSLCLRKTQVSQQSSIVE